MWDKNEINGYNHCTHVLKTGQINPDCDMGQFLIEIAKNKHYKKYLEIGTWNGLGSTKCFHIGFMDRYLTDSDFIFYSIECNADKCKDAQSLYDKYPFMKILHAKAVQSIPNESELINLFTNFIPTWHTVDIENMNECPYLFDLDCSKDFDVILLDGGEFTTYFEYLELKDHCRVLICDDCNTDKCSLIRKELMASNDWKLICENLSSRNGWCAFEKIEK
jgi:hypothetical protein